MAHAWWTGTSEIQPPANYKPQSRLYVNVGVLKVDGKRYVGDDVGQAMLMLPGDWLGAKIQRIFPRLESNFIRPLIVSFLIFVSLNLAAITACFYLLRLFDLILKEK